MSIRANQLIIRNGRLIDAASGTDAIGDLLISGNLIAEIGLDLEAPAAKELDASGSVVTPGLIDMHTHLRFPGFEEKETIGSGTLAAAAGGFTTICCMPNTDPTLDSPAALNILREKIVGEAIVRVLPIAAISRGRRGADAVDFELLAGHGVIGFSDDGDSCDEEQVMMDALKASRRLGLPIMVHCEEKSLMGGSMNEGEVSRKLGLRGLHAQAEELILERDLRLAKASGGWLYALHVSTGKGVDMIRQAKAQGVHVTAEVMPHHLLMTDEWVAGDRTLQNVSEPSGPKAVPADPNTKVNPPLRTLQDTQDLLTALQEGVFDIVATDHAPHAPSDKLLESFETAAFGMSGLEFCVPLMLSLVRAGHLSLLDLVRMLSLNPARVISSSRGKLATGLPADVTVIDPNVVWTVDSASLKTKNANTPLLGMELQGRARYTIVDGEIRYGA